MMSRECDEIDLKRWNDNWVKDGENKVREEKMESGQMYIRGVTLTITLTFVHDKYNK